MNVAAFYHVWGAGAWQAPLAEWREALADSEFPGPVYYCLAGSPDPDEWAERGVIVAEWHRKGNEYVTINALRRYALRHDGAILYAHTKGATAPYDGFRERWRRAMTDRVVKRWRENVDLLATVDAVGCMWLAEDSGGSFAAEWRPAPGLGFFAGNFWIASCNYLRRLPVCESVNRWDAEKWIGLGAPRVHDLLPGWPHDNRWTTPCV